MGKGKKKKRKENFYVVTISDNPKALTRAMRVTQGSRYFWGVVLSVLVVVLITFVSLLNYRNSVLNGRESVYISTVEKLQEENAKLKEENKVLTDKVEILSTTVQEKTEVVNAIEERSIPSGFPLSVAADFAEKEVEINEGGEDITCLAIEFSAGNGTFVLAPGDGTVKNVVEESEDNWKMEIDHGNGYVTIYNMPSKPKVRVGDEAAKGGPLCEIKSDKKSPKLLYMISFEGKYIDPDQILIING